VAGLLGRWPFARARPRGIDVSLAGAVRLGTEFLGAELLGAVRPGAVLPGLESPGIDRFDVGEPGVEHLIIELLLANPPLAGPPVIGRAVRRVVAGRATVHGPPCARLEPLAPTLRHPPSPSCTLPPGHPRIAREHTPTEQFSHPLGTVCTRSDQAFSGRQTPSRHRVSRRPL
jgi:hypothetical protein